jgi:Uncharacterized conserved protein (DUF2249)
MGVASVIKGERVIDVREISPRIRHTVIFQLFEHLDDVRSLQLIADHDPRPLRLTLPMDLSRTRPPTSGAFGCGMVASKLSRDPQRLRTGAFHDASRERHICKGSPQSNRVAR